MSIHPKAGNDGYWYIGDEEEQDANFNCNSGYIRLASGQVNSPQHPDRALEIRCALSVEGTSAQEAGGAAKRAEHGGQGWVCTSLQVAVCVLVVRSVCTQIITHVM